jgi:hypothetical protein
MCSDNIALSLAGVFLLKPPVEIDAREYDNSFIKFKRKGSSSDYFSPVMIEDAQKVLHQIEKKRISMDKDLAEFQKFFFEELNKKKDVIKIKLTTKMFAKQRNT